MSDSKKIGGKVLDFQNKNKEIIDKFLEDFCEFDYNDNDSSQNIEALKPRKSEETDKEGEFVANPPSIFLQSPSEKKSKSMTESIFKEEEFEGSSNDEDSSDEDKESDKLKPKYTLDLESSNNYEDKEEIKDESESIQKQTSKIASMCSSDRGFLTNTNIFSSCLYPSQTKSLKSYQKTISESDGKFDTIEALQNMKKNMLDKRKSFNEKSPFSSFTQTQNKGKQMSLLNKAGFSHTRTSFYRRGQKRILNEKEFLMEEIFTMDFDRPKEYKNFLPHNNLHKVIKKIKIDKLLNEKI